MSNGEAALKESYTLEELERRMCPPPPDPEQIVPAFEKRNVAICIVSSDEYSPFAGIVVHSIIANASEGNNYDIVILSDNMTVANHRRLRGLAGERKNISIRIINIERLISGLNFYTWAHFTTKSYYRLLVPDLFSEYEKVVYLDSDIVVNNDIAEMFAYDLDGFYMGAAYDTHIVGVCQQKPDHEQKAYNRETLKMENPEEYFQAGVSLYNIAAIRRDYAEGYLIEQASKHNLRWLDQDLVNMLFHKKIKRLPAKWNVMVANIPGDVREYFMDEDILREYIEARLDPYIIHYVGHAIPCFTDTPDLYDIFWHYARQTPYYEVLLQLMATESVKRTAPLCLPYNTQRHPPQKVHIRFKKRFKRVIDFFLPRGTKRRLFVYKMYVRMFGWE
ncbi:MAG: glycosyltransferase family 8 protein [Clostridium sp.]|nr:glycosyltransferase family 8 protein [Clostridium sp.]